LNRRSEGAPISIPGRPLSSARPPKEKPRECGASVKENRSGSKAHVGSRSNRGITTDRAFISSTLLQICNKKVFRYRPRRPRGAASSSKQRLWQTRRGVDGQPIGQS